MWVRRGPAVMAHQVASRDRVGVGMLTHRPSGLANVPWACLFLHPDLRSASACFCTRPCEQHTLHKVLPAHGSERCTASRKLGTNRQYLLPYSDDLRYFGAGSIRLPEALTYGGLSRNLPPEVCTYTYLKQLNTIEILH